MKTKTITGWAILIVVLVVFAGFISMNLTRYHDNKQMYSFFANTIGNQQSTLGGGAATTLTNGGCEIAPTISESAKDAENQATAVTVSYTYLVNDVYYSAEPTLNKGDKVKVMANASSWIDQIVDVGAVKCGGNTAVFLMGDYAAPTLQIKEDSTVLADQASGAGVNGSSVSAGGSETFRIFFTGSDKDTSGEMVYIVEVGSTQNVSSITMYNAATGASVPTAPVPSFYTNTLSSPKVVAFKVPAIDGAKEVEYKLTLVAKSGKTITGAMYTTAYVAEAYAEDDGTFHASGVEQIDGDTVYEATFDYDAVLV